MLLVTLKKVQKCPNKCGQSIVLVDITHAESMAGWLKTEDCPDSVLVGVYSRCGPSEESE